MTKDRGFLAFVCIGVTLMLVLPLLNASGAPNRIEPVAPATRIHIDRAYGKLPLSFEANQGQTDGRVKFLSRGRGYTVFLTSSEAVFVFTRDEVPAKRAGSRLLVRDSMHPGQVTQTVVRMKLLGAVSNPHLTGRKELPGKVNYFIGNDPKKWRTNVPTYARVEYRDVYPGINLAYYGNQRQLEYDFVVAPGADPQLIRLGFGGVDRLTVDARGNLVLHAAGGEILMHAPIVYQEIDGIRKEISGRYILKGKELAGFQVAAYDQTRPLVIDPVLSYSTYLGGTGALANAVAVDGAGAVYLTGVTTTDFPTTAGSAQPMTGGIFDAFVTKLSADGSALVYSTYLGGSQVETGRGIAVDASGNAYVVGTTLSPDFPTANPLQPALGSAAGGNAFVAKLDPAGSALIYSTYLGGDGGSAAAAIAVDAGGNAYLTGDTSSNFPTTPGAAQAALAGAGDAFVAKLNPVGSALVYATYLGGTDIDRAAAIAVDGGGNAYVTGQTLSMDFPTVNALQPACSSDPCSDAFVTKVNPTGSALVFATYLGGSAQDAGAGIAVDTGDNVYVTGSTFSVDFPTANAFQATRGSLDASDAFVTKLSFTGSGLVLVYSTYVGGTSYNQGAAIAVDVGGSAYITGLTNSTDFPTANAIQPAFTPPTELEGHEAFVAKLNPAGSALVYSTYLGGGGREDGNGIAVDSSGNAYVTGFTTSIDFPLVNPLQPALGSPQPAFDAFVVKISELAPNTPVGANVVVQPVDAGATLTFTEITQAGVSSLIRRNGGPAPPNGFSLGTPPTYYDITTTATFVSPVTVCITYGPLQFGDPSLLQLLHFEAGTWVDVTTSNDTVAHVICGLASSLSPFIVAQRVGTPLTSLGPANIWVGLKNSDAVGIRLDLRAEVHRSGTELVGSGQLASVPGGNSGFNNANQHAVALTPVAGVTFAGGETLSITLFVRNACTGSGKNSGTARLWFNDSAANSRFDATIGSPASYFLQTGFGLATSPGAGPKATVDVAAGAKCSPYKTFGTWSITLP
jgi:hypothetical protein